MKLRETRSALMNELRTVNYNSENMHKLQLAFTVKAAVSQISSLSVTR